MDGTSRTEAVRAAVSSVASDAVGALGSLLEAFQTSADSTQQRSQRRGSNSSAGSGRQSGRTRRNRSGSHDPSQQRRRGPFGSSFFDNVSQAIDEALAPPPVAQGQQHHQHHQRQQRRQEQQRREDSRLHETFEREIARRQRASQAQRERPGGTSSRPGGAGAAPANSEDTTSSEAPVLTVPTKEEREKRELRASIAGCRFGEMPIRGLKELLEKLQVDHSGCVEKSELIALCAAETWPAPVLTMDEEHQCTICFERRIDAVMVACGHQFCSVCTYGMTSCPMCKAPIEQRIRTFR